MKQPDELKLHLQVKLANGVISTTTAVWEILLASKEGNVQKVKELSGSCPELLYAQYNYTPPIHFAVREGHVELVKYLLSNGAHDPDYKTYPFLESLQTVAADRNNPEIVALLDDYVKNITAHKFKGDNGEIIYERNELEQAFEQVVYKNNLAATEEILKQRPGVARDETFFWGEGILLFAAKENNRGMIDLLISYGAQVPKLLKWAQFYYFNDAAGAAYMMEKGMSPDTMSWHEVTILHDMAQKGDLFKASLLMQYGADLNAIDDEYRSTPLGIAVRWGQFEMVNRLLEHGADPNKAGAAWSTPLAWAKRKGYAEIEKCLLQAGAER